MKATLMRWQEAALCLISKWWRPVLYLEYILSFAITLIIIPVVNWEVPDLTAAAAYLTAGAALTALRTYEKVRGVARGHS